MYGNIDKFITKYNEQTNFKINNSEDALKKLNFFEELVKNKEFSNLYEEGKDFTIAGYSHVLINSLDTISKLFKNITQEIEQLKLTEEEKITISNKLTNLNIPLHAKCYEFLLNARDIDNAIPFLSAPHRKFGNEIQKIQNNINQVDLKTYTQSDINRIEAMYEYNRLQIYYNNITNTYFTGRTTKQFIQDDILTKIIADFAKLDSKKTQSQTALIKINTFNNVCVNLNLICDPFLNIKQSTQNVSMGELHCVNTVLANAVKTINEDKNLLDEIKKDILEKACATYVSIVRLHKQLETNYNEDINNKVTLAEQKLLINIEVLASNLGEDSKKLLNAYKQKEQDITTDSQISHFNYCMNIEKQQTFLQNITRYLPEPIERIKFLKNILDNSENLKTKGGLLYKRLQNLKQLNEIFLQTTVEINANKNLSAEETINTSEMINNIQINLKAINAYLINDINKGTTFKKAKCKQLAVELNNIDNNININILENNKQKERALEQTVAKPVEQTTVKKIKLLEPMVFDFQIKMFHDNTQQNIQTNIQDKEL